MPKGLKKDVLYQQARGLVGWRVIGAKAIALTRESAFLHLINESGTLLWRQLGEPTTAAQASLILAHAYRLDTDEPVPETRAFLDRLVELGLAISKPGSHGLADRDRIPEAESVEGGYAPPSVLRFRSVPRLLRRLTIPSRGVVWRSLAPGSIIVEPKTGSYYTINESGDRLWRLLAHGTPSYGDLAGEIGQSYSKREEEILPDLIRFLKALSEVGLLEYAPGGAVAERTAEDSRQRTMASGGEYQPPVLTPVSKLEGLRLPPR